MEQKHRYALFSIGQVQPKLTIIQLHMHSGVGHYEMQIYQSFTLFTDLGFYDRYLNSLLECQHEEKASADCLLTT